MLELWYTFNYKIANRDGDYNRVRYWCEENYLPSIVCGSYSFELMSEWVWRRSCLEREVRVTGCNLQNRLIHELREEGCWGRWCHIHIADKLIILVHRVGLENFIRSVQVRIAVCLLCAKIKDFFSKIIKSCSALAGIRYIEWICVVW